MNNNPQPPSRQRYDLPFEHLHEGASNFDIRASDHVAARLRKRDSGVGGFSEVRVWDTSERAIEIVYPADLSQTWSTGDSVDLEITISGQRMLFEGLVVNQISANAHTKRIGIRYSRRIDPWSKQERRVGPRWVCSDQFYPTCIATSPFINAGPTIFQVRDVSSDGMQLTCDISKTYLVPKLKVRLTVNFPLVGDFVVNVEVARIGFDSIGGRDILSIGVRFLKLTEDMKAIIAQYLVEFSNVPSLQALRDNGFKPPEPKRGIEFYYAKTEQDLRDTWHLRKKAHLNDDNIAAQHVEDEDMSDWYDLSSRIILGKYRDRLVATARVHFGSLDYPLEQEGYVEWPKNMPRRDQIMEISRVALDPDFQKGDLLFGLFQFIVMSYREERPYVVLSAWPHQVKLYKKLGFSDTGLTHKEEFWRHKQNILIGNGLAGLCGKNMNPLVWNLTWRPAAERMIKNGIIEPKGMNRLRMAIYRLFAGPASLIQFFARGPRRIRKELF